MPHCLLTVLFLLDFIKTPSAISAGMAEEAAEEMEEESRVGDLAAESGDERLDSHGERRLPRRVSRRRDSGGTRDGGKLN